MYAYVSNQEGSLRVITRMIKACQGIGRWELPCGCDLGLVGSGNFDQYSASTRRERTRVANSEYLHEICPVLKSGRRSCHLHEEPISSYADESAFSTQEILLGEKGAPSSPEQVMSTFIDGVPAGGRIMELVELAKRTTSRLAELWEEVGYSNEEKARQMEGLIDGFRTLCENKEKQEKDVKNQFIASITDAKERMKKAREVLGQEGHGEEDSSANEMSLTDQLAYFEMEAESLRKTCKIQQEKFQSLSDEIVHLSVVLGEDSDADLAEWRDVGSSLTPARLQVFTQKKIELRKATEDRMNTIISLVSSIQNLMEELDLPPSTPLDNRIFGSLAIPSAGGVPVLQTPERTASSTGIDKIALNELCARQEELLNQRNALRVKLADMGDEIMKLWKQLDIGQDEQDAFSKRVEGFGFKKLDIGQAELTRLRKLKKEKIVDLMLSTRAKIRELWDETGCAEAERLAFKPMLVTEEGFTEELLQQHTQEYEKLSAKYDTMRNILEKIEEREALVHQRIVIATTEKDPSRYVPKGTSQERRQRQKRLQEELDAENRIKNRLPMLTNFLSKTIPQWEAAQGEAFLFKGERYLDTMQRTEDEFAALKDHIKAAKEAKKKEEMWKLAMSSPAPKASNAVALARGEGPRSTRKPPGSHRKAGGPGALRVSPRTQKRHVGSADRGSSGIVLTPERGGYRRSGSSEVSGPRITDVSNQFENGDISPGQSSKPRTSLGGNEDTENSSSIDSLSFDK